MKKLITILAIFLLAQGIFAQKPKVTNIITPLPTCKSNVMSFCADYQGNQYIATTFNGSFNIDTYQVTSNSNNICLFKISNNNSIINKFHIKSSGNVDAPSLKYMNNYIYSSFTFKDSIIINNIVYYSEFPLYSSLILKLDTNLNFVSVVQLGSTIIPNSLSILQNNNLVITIADKQVILDANLNILSVDSLLNYAAYIKLNQTNPNSYYSWGIYNSLTNLPQFDSITFQGFLSSIYFTGANMICRHNAIDKKPLWAVGISGEASSFGGEMNFLDIATDKSNNLIATGSYVNGRLRFHDGSYLTPTATSTGSYVVKYDSNGAILWKDFCIYGSLSSVDVDSFGDIYVAGNMVPNSNLFGGKVYMNIGGMFVAKYSSSGQELWSFIINSSNNIANGYINQIKVFSKDSFSMIGNYKWDSCTVDTTTINGNISIENGIYMACKLSNGTLQIAPNVNEGNGITLFPNPVSDLLNIKCENIPKSITIQNNLGNLIMEYHPSSSNTTLPISKLPTGYYRVQLLMQNGNIQSQQFIKQ